MFRRGLFRTHLIVALALPLASGVACSQSEPKTIVDVPAGKMPEGGDWRGVYYSQTYGFLHLEKSGSDIVGAWRTVAGDKWGELFGQVDGDVLKYEWKEHKIGMVGPNATVEGKGYFKYVVPKSGEAHEIQGEWGLDENNAGHSWAALKQTNMEPDLKSVRPNEIESRSGVEGWDGGQGDADLSDDPEKKKKKKKQEDSDEAGE